MPGVEVFKVAAKSAYLLHRYGILESCAIPFLTMK